jgi:hypothetical protein
MADVKEQGICIKFCLKLNKTAAETHRMLKAVCGEQALRQRQKFVCTNGLRKAPQQYIMVSHEDILKIEHFGKQIRNTLRVLKCVIGEGWRSVAPIV